MRSFSGIRRLLRPIHRPDVEADDEIRFHLEMRAQELIDAGTPADTARSAALHHFGDVASVRAALHAIDSSNERRTSIREWFGGVRQDIGYALRGLRREPSLATGVVVTFALAIGANAAMFGLVRQLMLAPPPGIAHANAVARVSLRRTTEDGEQYSLTTTSYPAFLALRATGGAFDAVAAARPDTITMGETATATEVAALETSGDYFTTLGARTVLGRTLGRADDDGVTGIPVVVLSHAFWARRFASDPDVIGREITLDDQKGTVVGVASPGFNGDGLAPVDVFIPLSVGMRKRDISWRTNEGMNVVSIVVRLRDGVSTVAASTVATAALRNILTREEGEKPVVVELDGVIPGREARQSTQSRVALWLAAVSVAVLIIAIANVATLLLLRALRRRREIAVRIALGAGRARLARQLFAESLLLAGAGAAAGLLVAHWIADIVQLTLLPNVAAGDSFVDQQTLIVSLIMAGVAGLLAGAAPLAQASQPNLTAELHGGSATGSASRSLLQRSLVGLQVALCSILLVEAGLFVRSLQRVQSQDLGFSTTHLLFVNFDFRGHPDAIERDRAYTESAARLEQLPGITGATVATAMPFGSFNVPPISVPGSDKPPSSNGQLPFMYGATPRFLDLLGVKLVQGRLFTVQDGVGTPLVVLVNETMARQVWPGQSALGRCIRLGFAPGEEPSPLAPSSLPCREVVGVVRQSRARSLRPDRGEATLMQYYVPFGQLPSAPMPGQSDVNGLIVRTAGDADGMAASVQLAIQTASRTPVYAHVRAYQDLLNPQLRPWKLGATLLSSFGLLAVGIAAVGLFGIIGYVVTQRTNEIGVRLALGATRTAVGGMIVRQALTMTGVGLAVGVVVALAAAPLVESMLFETSGRDLTIVGGAAVALLAITAAAAGLPAWRASRVDPLRALRAD